MDHGRCMARSEIRTMFWKEREHLENLGIDGSIMLEVRKCSLGVAHLACLVFLSLLLLLLLIFANACSGTFMRSALCFSFSVACRFRSLVVSTASLTVLLLQMLRYRMSFVFVKGGS